MEKDQKKTSLKTRWRRFATKYVAPEQENKENIWIPRATFLGVMPIFFIGTGVGELALVTMGMQTLLEWGRANDIKGSKTSYVLKRNDGLYYSYDVSKPQKAALEEIDKKLAKYEKTIVEAPKQTTKDLFKGGRRRLLEMREDILSDPKLGKPKLVSPQDYRRSKGLQ